MENIANMPGFGYLAAAYAVVWVVMFVYLMSIVVREKKIERELEALNRIVTDRERGSGRK